jgi:hypothetical protein
VYCENLVECRFGEFSELLRLESKRYSVLPFGWFKITPDYHSAGMLPNLLRKRKKNRNFTAYSHRSPTCSHIAIGDQKGDRVSPPATTGDAPPPLPQLVRISPTAPPYVRRRSPVAALPEVASHRSTRSRVRHRRGLRSASAVPLPTTSTLSTSSFMCLHIMTPSKI